MSNLKAIHEASRLQPINKLMVVGHPLSGFEQVEASLQQSGLKSATASKLQGLTPRQVSEMVLRAYRIVPITSLHAVEIVHPIKPSPVWQTLALDLLLGNIEHELWGWSDPQAIYLLDYWKSLDNQVAFILVYDSPQDTLNRLLMSPEIECNADMISALVTTWLAYNEALLNFYLGHTECCLLVSSQQVVAHSSDYLAQVQYQMGVELHQSAQEPNLVSEASPWKTLQLTDQVLLGYTKAMQLYTDLQSVASLPFKPSTGNSTEHSALAVLHSFVQMHRSNLQIQHALQAIKHNHLEQEQAFQTKLAELLKGRQQVEDEKKALNAKLSQLQESNASLQKVQQASQASNLQIQHDLQALKHNHLEQEQSFQNKLAELLKGRQQVEDEKKALNAKLSQLQELNASLQKAQQAAQEANAAIATANLPAVNHTQVKELEEENKLLLEQLHLVQEELERYFLENQDLKKKQPKPPDKVYGAAQRVQQQLNYRLGATMIAHSRSFKGWLRMPKALLGEVRVYRKEQSTEAAQKLPPLETYADAHEAERYRRHLSYQLGQTMLKHAKTPWGWMWMPLALAVTTKNFRRFRT